MSDLYREEARILLSRQTDRYIDWMIDNHSLHFPEMFAEFLVERPEEKMIVDLIQELMAASNTSQTDIPQ